MKLEELSKYGIPEEYIQKFREEKIFKLYPPQEDVLTKRDFKEGNLVISLPTAGGKTLIATLAILNKILNTRQKVVYIVPLVALANEKYEYFRNFFGKKYKVAISVGDLDSADPWLGEYDLIICTTEKLDSLIRHGAPWLKTIGLIIVDEIHLLNDPSRGPTLEILLTRLREVSPKSQIFGLSATIRNAGELAKWLNAHLILSDFRPVTLHEGVAFDSKIFFHTKKTYNLSNLETEAAILENTFGLNKQALFFVSTRKGSEKLAEDLGRTIRSRISRSESFHLTNLASDIENVLEIPTKQCRKLGACIRSGVSFHHAGLLGKQKRLIEENFRKGLIKAISATPTLALGVNLPAFRVVIRDAKRYYSGIGASYIPVLEYKQMTGRAGRPAYDEFGESILVAKSESEAQELVDHFIMGEPENIMSKLAIETILRMHVLALVADDFCRTEDSLLEFFSKTFYAHQYGDLSIIEEKLFTIIENLTEWKFITSNKGNLKATGIGKRVSELYIDPFTAHLFVLALNSASKRKNEPFSFLQTVCNSTEMRPLLSVRQSELPDYVSIMTEKEKVFLQKIPEEWDLDFDDFLKGVKTAVMLEDWINESTEDEILTKFRVTPGELRSRLRNVDWLIYSMHELAILLGHKDILKDIRKTRIRLMYGVKEELIPLVRLKNIGRVRARKLFRAGLKSLNELRKISIDSLNKIVGSKTALSIKNQIEGKKQAVREEEQKTLSYEKFI